MAVSAYQALDGIDEKLITDLKEIFDLFVSAPALDSGLIRSLIWLCLPICRTKIKTVCDILYFNSNDDVPDTQLSRTNHGRGTWRGYEGSRPKPYRV